MEPRKEGPLPEIRDGTGWESHTSHKNYFYCKISLHDVIEITNLSPTLLSLDLMSY